MVQHKQQKPLVRYAEYGAPGIKPAIMNQFIRPGRSIPFSVSESSTQIANTQ